MVQASIATASCSAQLDMLLGGFLAVQHLVDHELRRTGRTPGMFSGIGKVAGKFRYPVCVLRRRQLVFNRADKAIAQSEGKEKSSCVSERQKRAAH